MGFQLIKKLRAAAFYDLEDIFEAVNSPVIRVGDLTVSRLRVKVTHAGDFFQMFFRSHLLQIGKIFVVHGQNEIKIIQVEWLEASGFGMKGDAVLPSCPLALAVGRFPFMEGGSPGGINLKEGRKPPFLHLMLKNALRGGTPADVSQANKTYFVVIFFGYGAFDRQIHACWSFKQLEDY